MIIKKIRFTRDGFEEKKKEYNNLLKERIRAVSELQRAREMGDLSENAAYKVARSHLSGVDRRLRYLERIIKDAEIVPSPENGMIGIGSRISMRHNNETMTVMLVDSHEGDMSKGKISIYSPIGKAILGKKKGDCVEVITPSGIVDFYIQEIM